VGFYLLTEEIDVKAIAKGIAGVAGLGVAAFAGTTALEDNTTRNDDGAITESGGLGAFQMRVGDCFNHAPAEDDEFVASVEGVPCNTPHDNEVFAEFDVAPAAVFPGQDAIYEEAWLGCLDRFEEWVRDPTRSRCWRSTHSRPLRRFGQRVRGLPQSDLLCVRPERSEAEHQHQGKQAVARGLRSRSLGGCATTTS